MKNLLSIGMVFTFSLALQAQNAPTNWYNKSPQVDKMYGTAADKAYELLKDKTPQEVVVAVIDSGVETDHPDLKEVIWVNKGEIPNNGIDDDKNGYIDDVHGWSFLGGATEDIDGEALEIARIYHKEKKYFDGKDVSNFSTGDAERYQKYQKIKEEFELEQNKNIEQYQQIKLLSDYINNVKASSNGVFSKKTNKAYAPKNELETKIKKRMGLILAMIKPEELDKQITEGSKMLETNIKMNTVDADSIRRAIVGDDPNDYSNPYYGCNRYEGPDAMHGTHVSGIIAAKRGNGIGIDGIAANAKIMVLRAVPNGDERDKDVANAIRYAVDNGAKVINMSFGKYYTMNKSVVDEAIQYAKSKDVLLVHAAGNDAYNKDEKDSYPTRILDNGTVASNWIDVGASSSSKSGKKLIADFSNYGKTTVDFFAPGVDIFSTVPDFKYEDASGTSMACPATAGVCAMLRGYFPELSAEEIKDVLMKTVEPYKKKVTVPGKKDQVLVSDISIAGGFVNVYNAVNYLMKK